MPFDEAETGGGRLEFMLHLVIYVIFSQGSWINNFLAGRFYILRTTDFFIDIFLVSPALFYEKNFFSVIASWRALDYDGEFFKGCC